MERMTVAVGADAYGYALKVVVKRWLEARNCHGIDAGIDTAVADEKILDYADAVAGAVSRGDAARGILLCMSGGLMGIRANRWGGVRAVMAMNEAVIRHDREASDSNVLCVAAQGETEASLAAKLAVFMETPFEPLARRMKRLAQVDRPVG